MDLNRDPLRDLTHDVADTADCDYSTHAHCRVKRYKNRTMWISILNIMQTNDRSKREEKKIKICRELHTKLVKARVVSIPLRPNAPSHSHKSTIIRVTTGAVVSVEERCLINLTTSKLIIFIYLHSKFVKPDKI